MKTIFEYSCYRDFVGDRIEDLKKNKDYFSYQYVANKVGVSKSYLKLVSQKKRHISLEKVPPLSDFFELNDDERRFFTVLYLLNSSHNPELKMYFEGARATLAGRALSPTAADKSHDPAKTARFFSDALAMTIQSLAKRHDFQPSPDWIAKRIRSKEATRNMISDSLEWLIKEGLIRQKENKWEASEFPCATPDPMDPGGFKVYQTGHLQAYAAAEKPVQFRPCHFHMLSICVKREEETGLLEKFEAFKKELVDLGKSRKEGDTVFFISNNIFTAAD